MGTSKHRTPTPAPASFVRALSKRRPKSFFDDGEEIKKLEKSFKGVLIFFIGRLQSG
jgi:hypothetical protein